MKRQKLLWALPLLLLLGLIIALVLALPSLVSSTQHRATFEALASSLTGREVHIKGRLSLALLPAPQFVAENIQIAGPDSQTITAKSLTLQIAPLPLLRGQVSARNIILQSPVINLPWPLPAGPGAIAPPPWLATLHAQINNGQINLGGLKFNKVSADIFTGADGAVSIGGNGLVHQLPISLNLSLGALDDTGAAPLSLDFKAAQASGHFAGALAGSGNLTGALAITAARSGPAIAGAAPPLTATGDIVVNATAITLANLKITQAGNLLAGNAFLPFAKPLIALHLTGSGLALPQPGQNWPAPDLAILQNWKIHLDLELKNLIAGAVTYPGLRAVSEISATGINISQFSANLPQSGTLSLQAHISPAGDVTGKASLDSANLDALLAMANAQPGFGKNQTLNLATPVSGNLTQLSLDNLTGSLAGDSLAGQIVLRRQPGELSVGGSLHFGQLSLDALAAAFSHYSPPTSLAGLNITADGELTADHASFHNITLTHLLADAAYNNQLIVRRFSASAYNGRVNGSFSLSPGGQISAAQVMLSLPSATPLTALLPAVWQPPAAVMNAPLALLLAAAGPANAFATSAVMTLGPINITAAPVLDFIGHKAAGPITLRHPSAIAAFKAFGLNAGLPWPGAGSISLRADFTASPAQFGLPDFVLSMGDLTAAGSLTAAPDGKFQGQISADTLALPPPPGDFTPAWNFIGGTQGVISLTANRVLVAGAQISGPGAASLNMQPGKAALTLTRLQLAKGLLTGSILATMPPGASPLLALKLQLHQADLSQLALPIIFPLQLPSGMADAQINATASGYQPPAWAATLNGTASLSAEGGTLAGFSLLGMAAPDAASLKAACLAGITAFSSLKISGQFNQGVFTLADGDLRGPAGAANAAGSIDLPDRDLALQLTLLPTPAPAAAFKLSLLGGWAHPHRIPGGQAAKPQ